MPQRGGAPTAGRAAAVPRADASAFRRPQWYGSLVALTLVGVATVAWTLAFSAGGTAPEPRVEPQLHLRARRGCRVVVWKSPSGDSLQPAGSAPCEWTTDRDDWQSADAIVFVPTYFDLAETPDPKLKPLGQLWVLAGAEQPRLRARPEVLDALVDHVDLWGTPDERSDLWSIYPLPDPNQWRAGSGARRHLRDVDTGPSTFVFAAISNCDELLTRRLEIVKGVAAQLQKVAPVLANRSRFRGKCLSGKMDSDRLQQRQTALHDTEFALAFENSFYPDYATEKLFDALDVGAIPVVQGGARYSDLAPRDPQDELGQHPVFIDALSFDSPSDLADYLVWLHRTGNTSNYRPWLRLPDKARAEAGEGAQQQSAAGAEAPDRHAGWPCSHSDVVRCGMAGMRLTLDPATCGASLVTTVHRQLGREPDLRRVCHQRIRGAGDAGIARQSGLGLSEVSGAWAPWRLPGADPTLDEYRRLHGLPRGRLGAGDLVLDQDRCRGCEPGQVCVATAATEARLRRLGRTTVRWVKAFSRDCNVGTARGRKEARFAWVM
ncbi:hypothetical protein FNF28_07616 [Cafeteria roenbergensis]|uniref:Fucosyltransferase n=1 Tax=Cafeteria roenbergensis TaxID=33653 RepID=A0A5A8C1N3_CAFRO|nr:hypothetical protein FNF28_07616 [Cafeteria roenbergensis]